MQVKNTWDRKTLSQYLCKLPQCMNDLTHGFEEMLLKACTKFTGRLYHTALFRVHLMFVINKMEITVIKMKRFSNDLLFFIITSYLKYGPSLIRPETSLVRVGA